jgi:hypothetical protein
MKGWPNSDVVVVVVVVVNVVHLIFFYQSQSFAADN